MSDQNIVAITGRLGRSPELKNLASGTSVVDISVAVQDGWGENEKTAWLGVTFWGKAAEALANHCTKGQKIWVSGRLSQESWDDKETGKKNTRTKVTASQWGFCESKKASAGEPAGQPSSQQPTPPNSQPAGGDDIPF